MGNKFNKTRELISDKLELPRDVILNLPRIVVTGDSEITIENHNGIVLFENNFIKINSTVGIICVYGCRFEIVFIGGGTITINGKFKSIVYEGNE